MAKKTMADFFREIHRGMKIQVIEQGIKPETIGTVRVIKEVRTRSIVCEGPFHIEVPRANLLTYDGESFTIYQPGTRHLTIEEQRVHEGRPNEYFAEKSYLSRHKMEYLGHEAVRGMRIIRRGNGVQILDERIRGQVLVTYKIIGREYQPKTVVEYHREIARADKRNIKKNTKAQALEKVINSGAIQGIIFNGRKIKAESITYVSEVAGGLRVEVGGDVITVPKDNQMGIKSNPEVITMWHRDENNPDTLEIIYKTLK